MKYFGVASIISSIFLAFTTAVPAGAATIDFEAQSVNSGGSLTGIPDSPLAIGAAMFSGGELRNGEVGLNADRTGVYASQGLFGSGETNPLVISFASPVQAVSILVLNGDDTRSYTVSDNWGDSVTKSLSSAGSLGAATFSLPGTGITQLTITSANADAWDFAIDDLTFSDAAVTPTPEPQSILLLGGALLVLGGVFRKRVAGAMSKKH